MWHGSERVDEPSAAAAIELVRCTVGSDAGFHIDSVLCPLDPAYRRICVAVNHCVRIGRAHSSCASPSRHIVHPHGGGQSGIPPVSMGFKSLFVIQR